MLLLLLLLLSLLLLPETLNPVNCDIPKHLAIEPAAFLLVADILEVCLAGAFGLSSGSIGPLGFGVPLKGSIRVQKGIYRALGLGP